MKINIKKLKDNAVIPTRRSAQAAGYDLYACLDDGIVSTTLCAGETKKIGTGVAVAIPDGYVGLIFARSGLATKKGIRPANCVGVIDSDYRGELIVALHSDTGVYDSCVDAPTISAGERIAQLVIMPYLPVEFEEVNELDSTERGEGGFGSTGQA